MNSAVRNAAIIKLRTNKKPVETIEDVLNIIESYPQGEKPWDYSEIFSLGNFDIYLNGLFIVKRDTGTMYFLDEDDDHFWLKETNPTITDINYYKSQYENRFIPYYESLRKMEDA